MSPSAPEVAALFNMLESNNKQDVEDIKGKFAEMFNTNRDTWLAYGLIDYHQSTGSMRAVEILVKAPVPHHKFIFDKLAEGLKAHWRGGALGLLGHVVRRQPVWLYKITGHPLFRELLQLLRHERDVVTLMSALLVLITLVPMIPTLVSPFFQEIFDVFGRLAAWDSRQGDGPRAGQREHLQLGLYGLFHNLYGMYPCNFVDYLKREYGKRENAEIFTHTVKPMLETVRMHPLLITASKNAETDNARWSKMEHHDVLVECRRFSSESAHLQRGEADDSRFRARCGTDVSSLLGSTAPHIQTSKSSNSTPNLTESQTLTKNTVTTMPSDPASVAMISYNCEGAVSGGDDWFSLAEVCGASASTLSAPQTPLPLPANAFDTPVSHTPVAQPGSGEQDSGSPPEAAIEATPENTPIKDTRPRFNFPNNSPVVRALGSRLSQPQQFQSHLSSSLSQPPSPLKKEPSPFNRMSSVDACSADFPEQKKDAYYSQFKINRVLQDRSQQTPEIFSINPSPQKRSSGSPLKKGSFKDCGGSVPSVPNSPVPLGATAPVSGSTDWPLAKPKPQRDGAPLDASAEEFVLRLHANAPENNRDDREIIELSKRGEVTRSSMSGEAGAGRPPPDAGEDAEEPWAEDEPSCEGEAAHCGGKHGLHMPHSTSMLDFARRVTRLRFSSQCILEPMTDSITRLTLESDRSDFKMRKSSSCPDVKSPNFLENGSATKSKIKRKTRDVDLAEDSGRFLSDPSAVAFENGKEPAVDLSREVLTRETQTVDVWPSTYEYLFTDILQNCYRQSVESGDTSDAEDKGSTFFSPYGQVDRYIETLAHGRGDRRSCKSEVDHLRQQLQLLQLELLYERHRREVHAYRNRRLLGRSRKNRAAEEQNQALKQQMQQMQDEIDDLRIQVGRQRSAAQGVEQKRIESNRHWQQQMLLRDAVISAERVEKEKLAAMLMEQRSISGEASGDVQHLHAALFDVSQQLHRATRKSEVSDRLMECLKRMQRELILCGERDARYRELLTALPSRTDVLVGRLAQQYREQLVTAQALLQSQTAKMDYLQAREGELESTVAGKDLAAQELKRQLRLVKEEYGERLKTVEDKYQSIKRINQRMEAHCLELLQRVPQSPQATSRELTSGLSPQSSPLSASLASSEGPGPPLASRVDEIRNLQVIVNAHEAIRESASDSVNDAAFNEENRRD